MSFIVRDAHMFRRHRRAGHAADVLVTSGCPQDPPIGEDPSTATTTAVPSPSGAVTPTSTTDTGGIGTLTIDVPPPRTYPGQPARRREGSPARHVAVLATSR